MTHPSNTGKRLLVVDAGTLAYEAAWELQESLVTARAEGRVSEDVLLLLEHPHVFTIGRRGGREHLLTPRDDAGEPIPVFDVNRGGDITYHGPGQLVGYPILALEGVGGDVVAYLRMLEAILISACATLGVEAGTNPPFTGVWSGGQKLGSLGVGVKRRVTLHGFALNVATDLGYFTRIIPCGLHGVSMTSLSQRAERPISMESAREAVVASAAEILVRTPVPHALDALKQNL